VGPRSVEVRRKLRAANIACAFSFHCSELQLRKTSPNDSFSQALLYVNREESPPR
jgi:hypothetical protein